MKLRLLWYRSLPVSCIEYIQLRLDDQAVDPGVLRFGVNGRQYQLDELVDLVEEFWFIQDAAILSINQPGRLTAGSTHKIELDLALRFPYIPIGPGKFLTRINKYSAALVAG
ncbi:MAG: hypothetical protein A2136_08710 [Chloroflexi bacterium RBG_16_54_11]|nr:MAG: hypothetical protein A2136_08710 [Chloroflexi bacterium RBG_16_54_11]